MMSINPDAHSTREIDLTHWGVEMARKGGVPKQRILNCLSKEKFAEYLEGRRDQRRGKRSVPRRSRSRNKQRRQGLRPVRILLDENRLRRAHSHGAPNEYQRHDVEALQKALLGLLYRAKEDLP